MYGIQDDSSVDQDQVTITLTNENNEQVPTLNINGSRTGLQCHHYHAEDTADGQTGKDAEKDDSREVQDKVAVQEKGTGNKVRVEIEEHTDDDEDAVRTPNALFLASNAKRKNRLTIVDNLATHSHSVKTPECT